MFKTWRDGWAQWLTTVLSGDIDIEFFEVYVGGIYLFLFCLYMWVPAYMYVHHLHACAHGGKKGILESMELEL